MWLLSALVQKSLLEAKLKNYILTALTKISKQLTLVEETFQKAHVDHMEPNLNCILVILLSRYSPTGILTQREDFILEWIFLPHKPNKKLKPYV